MNTLQRRSRLDSTSVELVAVTKICPECGESALVGGPHPDNKAWVIQPHGPNPVTLCSGTGSHVHD